MATKTWIATSSTSFNTSGNWTPSGAPANNDTLVFNFSSTQSCTSNLTTGLTGLTIIVEKSFTGNIGLAGVSGTNTFLDSDGLTAYIGQKTGAAGSPSGSQLIALSNGTTAATINLYDSPTTSSTTYWPPVLVKGGALTINQSGGILGIAVAPGETAAATVNIAKGDGDTAPACYIGPGVTSAAITINNGTVSSRSDNTTTAVTLSDNNSTYNFQGTGAHTTVTVDLGTVNHAGVGTITTLNLKGTFNRNKDTRALTITTANLYGGAVLDYDNGKSGSTTITNKSLLHCGMQDVTIRTPEGDLF